jgi:hypothetical protein
MALPQGWKRDFSTNDDVTGKRKIYEVVYTLPNAANGAVTGGKYAVVFNAKTGARDIYTQDPLFGTRELLLTINSDGTRTKGPVYNEIAGRQNGNTRISDAVNASQVNINRLINSSDTVNGLTAEEKARLKKEKVFGGSGTTAPPSRSGGGNPDEAGGNTEPQGSESGTPVAPEEIASFRNVSSFQSEEQQYGDWHYPEIMNKLQDYMMIQTYNYQTADVFGGGDGITNINSGLIFGGANLSSRTLKNILGSVILPMPATISEANQTGWGEDSLSNLSAGLMGSATGAVSSIAGGDLIGGTADLVGEAKKLFESAGAKAQIKQQLTLNAAASLVKKLGVNVNAENYRARVTGTVINPNLELLFNGPKLRAFQFSYKLAPRSREEARQVRGIIKFFKKAMAPKRSAVGGSGDEFFLGAPNVFQIKFMNGSKPSKTLPTLKTCALVNFNVNYTADGFYSAYIDGQPVSVQIDLSFAELTPIYNDNYGNVGDGTVGFRGDKSLDDLEDPLFDPKEVQNQQSNADTPTLTEEEVQRQSTRPENRGRTPEQIRSDRGAIALEYQRNVSILYRANATQAEKDAALKRIQELSASR